MLNVSRVTIHRLWVSVYCWQVWTLGRSVRGHWGPCAGSGQRAVTTTFAVSVHNANFSRSCSMHVISLFGHKEVPREKRHFDTWLWHLWTMTALLYEWQKEVFREIKRHIDTWRFDTFESRLLCWMNLPWRFQRTRDVDIWDFDPIWIPTALGRRAASTFETDAFWILIAVGRRDTWTFETDTFGTPIALLHEWPKDVPREKTCWHLVLWHFWHNIVGPTSSHVCHTGSTTQFAPIPTPLSPLLAKYATQEVQQSLHQFQLHYPHF